MKKILLLLSTVLLILTSCSSDNNDVSNLQEPVLVKEIAVTYNDKTDTQKIAYDGNRIKNITFQSGFKTIYTYTGDVITNVQDFDPVGILLSARIYKYSNGEIYSVLSRIYGYEAHYTRLQKFFHNKDRSVSYQNFKVDPITGEEMKEDASSGKFFFKEGNIIKHENYYNGVLNYVLFEDYDSKYDSFKNILGYNLLLDLMPTVNNSVKSYTIIESKVANEVINVYEYNSKGYPVKKMVNVVNGVPFSVVKYTY